MDFLDRISLSHRYLRMLINTNTDPLNVAEPFFVAFFFFFLGDSKHLAASTTHNAPLPLSVQTSGNIHFVVQRFQTECLTYNAFGGPTTGTQTLHDFLKSNHGGLSAPPGPALTPTALLFHWLPSNRKQKHISKSVKTASASCERDYLK